MIIDIECYNFDDDDSYNHQIYFVIRDDDFNRIRDGGCVDGDVEYAFFLQRVISKFYPDTYVCMLSGSLWDDAILHEDVFKVC